MRYILVILLLSCNFLFAQIPELFNLDGYKILKFGMSIEEADNKITNYNTKVYADFYEQLKLKDSAILNIYKNEASKLTYYLYFYDNRLYRIEIANHIGNIYNNPVFYKPANSSDIQSLKERLSTQYGKATKSDVKYYSYYKKAFEEYIFWWTSDLASVSLYIKPDLDSLNKTIKLFSYRISFYDEIQLRKIYSKS